MKKKHTLKIIAAAGACAMALTLLPAGSAQAAATYLPTKEVDYSYEDGKWVKEYSVNTTYNKRGAVVKSVDTEYVDGSKYVSTTKSTYKGSKLTSKKTYLKGKLIYKMNVSYKKGLPSVMKTKYGTRSAKTVFKYKGKLPVTVTATLYEKNKKNGYEKYIYKKGRLVSKTHYSYNRKIVDKYSYKNGDRVKTDFTTYTNGKKNFYGTTKDTYKKHRLVKSVTKTSDGMTTTYNYNKKGLQEKTTYKDPHYSYQMTNSYKYYKNNTVKQITFISDDGRKSKTVYSGFKKFKSTPASGILDECSPYLGE